MLSFCCYFVVDKVVVVAFVTVIVDEVVVVVIVIGGVGGCVVDDLLPSKWTFTSGGLGSTGRRSGEIGVSGTASLATSFVSVFFTGFFSFPSTESNE